jgi:chromosome segregation ATPase
MSEPNFSNNFESEDRHPVEDAGERRSLDAFIEDAPLDDGSMSPDDPHLTLMPTDKYARLLDELAKTRSLECQHIRRIYQLEKALDQSLIYLEELRLKSRDRDNLYDQLLMTEDFAYVQQHAIAHLKKQLKQQKQILISQSSDAREYDEAVQTVLGETEQLVEYQQVELEHIKSQLAQDLADHHRRYSQLQKKAELLQSSLASEQERTQRTESDALASRTLAASLEIQLAASQQQVRELSVRLAESQTRLLAMEGKVKKAEVAAAEHDEMAGLLRHSEEVIADHNRTIATLKRELAIAESSTAHLNTERLKGIKDKTELLNRCRLLESETDKQQSTVSDLERQNAELQEEIFQQTHQLGEYEAAIQFWKERYQSSQRQLEQLKLLVEREGHHLSDGTAAGLMQALQLVMQADEEPPDVPSIFPSPRFNTVDMPEFLIRRHAVRHRSLPTQDFKSGSSTDDEEAS